MTFSGQTAVVTGAASGMGQHVAEALAQQGADVLFADFSPAVTDIATQAGAASLVGDVSAPEFPSRISEWLDGRGLKHLVTAAGIQLRTPAIDVAEEQWQRLLEVNLSSFYRLVRHLHDALRQGDGTQPGSVVAFTSMSTTRVLPNIVPYGSVKAGLEQLLRGLAVELGPEGIRLNAVAPGYVTTGMTRDMLAQPANQERILAHTPLGRIGEPEDVTAPVLFLLSDAARFITGHTIPVDGGYPLT